MSITAKRLRELLHYDPTTGVFTWAIRVSNCVKVSDIAGSMTGGRYWHIKLDGKKYQAHRLAWFHAYGEWPKGEVDHIDGDRLNNRIANLRDVPSTVNQHNLRRAFSNNKLGLLGVSQKGNRFLAEIQVSRKKIHVGYFATAAEAHAAYVAAKRKHHEGCTL